MFLLLGVTLFTSIAAERWEEAFETTDSFVFIDRFAFVQTDDNGTTSGMWEFTFFNTSELFTKTPTPQNDVQVDLYYDSDDSWFAVWDNDSMSCQEKRQRASDLNNKSVSTSSVIYGDTELVRILDTKAPHFWYMAVSNCNAMGKSWAVQYKIHATNPGGWWTGEFSVDQSQLLGLYFAFTFFFYLPLMVVVAIGLKKLHQSDSLSSAPKMIAAFLGLQFVAALFEFCHLASFASNGFGVPFLNRVADLFQSIAEIVFIVLLLALAQGWCVSTLTFRDPNAIKGVTAIVVLTYMVLLFWRIGGESPESTLYYYESVPGGIALFVRCVLCIYFVVSLRLTFRETASPKLRNFFIVFGALYTVWFLVLIFIVLIGAATPAVYREQAVEVMTTLQSFTAGAVLFALFSPWIAHKFFDIGNAKSSLLGSSSSLSSPLSSSSSYRAIDRSANN